MIEVDVGKLRHRGVVNIDCTCTACDVLCTRRFVSIDEFEASMDGICCPYANAKTKWMLNKAYDNQNAEMKVDYVKHTEIDGKDYIVTACRDCPFADGGDDGYGACCNYPQSEDLSKRKFPLIDYLWDDVEVWCPLRGVDE